MNSADDDMLYCGEWASNAGILKIMAVMGMSQCWKSRNNSTFNTIAGVLPHE
jgi:hypothetical protein